MSLTSIGRKTLSRMVALAGQEKKTARFNLIDDVNYDPTTGEAVTTGSVVDVDCFASRPTDAETKLPEAAENMLMLVFADGKLPRRPSDQDEVTIDGMLWKVEKVEGDPMGAALYVTVCRS